MADVINRQKIEQFGNLELLAKVVVEGFITGLHKSPFHGFSVEFAEHRLYNNGESTRHIDWKMYAKTDKMFVKRYEEETNLRCQVIIDHSSSMYFPVEAKSKNIFNKIEFSAYCAAALTELLKRQRDAIGLSIFSDSIETHTPAKSNLAHQKLLFNVLENLLKQHQNKTTAAIDALHEIANRIHRRSLVVIFSDLMDSGKNIDDLMHALQHLKYNKHEVLLFHVLDKKLEIDFDFENRPYTFIDLETGAKMKLHPTALKEKYIAQMANFEHDIKLKCGQLAIDYIAADINEGFEKVLLAYLIKRNKMIK